MQSIERFRLIQAFKVGGSAVSGGVNYAHVIAPYLYDLSLKGLLKKVIFSLFMGTRLMTKDEHHPDRSTLLFYSARYKRREDYDYIPSWLHGVLAGHCSYVESNEVFSLAQPLRTLIRLPAALIAAKGFEVGIFQRVGVALLIAKYRATADVFNGLLNGLGRLVTFCDAQPAENLLAQMAKARGMRTYTNQHGQYRVLDKTNMSPDAEAYANFVSDKLLCWGEATCGEFAKAGFSKDRMAITGWIRQWNLRPANTEKQSKTKVFGVMLNGDNGKVSNFHLVQVANRVAQELGMRFIVRLHPWSHPRQYQSLVAEHCLELNQFPLSSYLDRVDFSLAHMSGAIVEVLYSGACVYLLDDGALAHVFRQPGLSYQDASAIVAAIGADRLSADGGRARMLDLARWYNDDQDQVRRVQSAILE